MSKDRPANMDSLKMDQRPKGPDRKLASEMRDVARVTSGKVETNPGPRGVKGFSDRAITSENK